MVQQARKAHLLSAAFLGLFIAQHLLAHLFAVDSIAAQARALQLGRNVYRVAPIEILLLLAFAAQVALGLRLAWSVRRSWRLGGWHRARIASGIYLAFFIVAHASANLLARFLYMLDTDFYWAAGSLTLDPLRWGFAPYYGLALVALGAHLGAALRKRGMAGAAWIVALSGPAIALPILLAYGGAFYDIVLPADIVAYYADYGAQAPAP